MLVFAIFATYRQVLALTAVGYNCVDCEWREKVSAFSLFYCDCQKLSKTQGYFVAK